ncbi:MAG: hypothetical protein QNJ62_05250 [Methyloceanibacter sp.]|nr:hypothetical protein [Methyloceanibacter sp.]
MMTEMLKQLSLSVFGLALGVAVLVANTDTALADRNKTYWVDGSKRYTNEVTVKKRKDRRAQTSQQRFLDGLDTETEAVWRNLRPNRFPD